jgi:cyclophilin family peptidyl-prolyl cis-trans isomerase
MLARTALCICVFVLFVAEAGAVELTLARTNVTMPSGQTFQMPITASDPDGQPLHFAATVSNKKVTAVFAPSSNRSLLINVSGVDATNGAFTGAMVLQLFEDITPLTTARIIDLVNSNFYNGLLFQRVIKGFVAQGGGATNDPNFESGVTFDDEYVASLIYDGFGQLGMANMASSSGNNSTHDSNSSQFFITDVDLSIDNPTNTSPKSLNFEQPIFGQLTSGFDVLAEIMSTPVGLNDQSELSAPLSNVVINTASIITNSQDAVLRLTAAQKFRGTVTVTVSATNAANKSVTQALQVNVITDTNTSPAFLGPIPSNITVTQNVAAAFVVTSTDIDGLPIYPAWLDLDTYPYLTNMVVTYNPKTKLISFSPDLTLTGVVNMIIGVTDRIHNYDTQQSTLTFLPWSATPTMKVVPLKGSMQDSGKPFGDRISVSGTFSFSGSDQTFGSNDVLELTLGDPGSPLNLEIVPNDSPLNLEIAPNGNLEIVPNNEETRLSKGVYSGTARGVISGLSSNITVSAQISIPKGTFTISASNFNFPVPLTNQMLQVGIALGNNYGSDTRKWGQTKPGTFVLPAP